MQKLSTSCCSLKKLEIKYCDLNEVESTDFSENLVELNLIKCEIPLRWFKNNKFKILVNLNLSGSSRVCSTHIQDLVDTTALEKLENLNLKNCYRINDKSIEILLSLPKINSLNLSETDLTQYGLQLICSKLSNSIKFLSIKKCKNINETDSSFVRQSFVNNEKFQLEF